MWTSFGRSPGYIRRRGLELGGESGELASMAADQERLLRALVSGVSAPHADVALDGDAVGGDVDLRLLLARFADGAVHIVPPAEPVLTAPGVADELEAARGRARQRPPACR